MTEDIAAESFAPFPLSRFASFPLSRLRERAGVRAILVRRFIVPQELSTPGLRPASPARGRGDSTRPLAPVKK